MSTTQAAAGSRGTRPNGVRRRNGHAEIEPAAPIPKIPARIAPRADDNGVRARILVTLPSGAEVDVTRALVSALAHELWQLRGEDHLTNWLDAESVLNQMLDAGVPAGTATRRANPVPARSATISGARRISREKDDDEDVVPGSIPPRSPRLRRL